ncbi:MAG: glycerate kinase, partial [Actinomycetales bacterium]|nr:glycerate kinase [Actinomycetales bacterium]
GSLAEVAHADLTCLDPRLREAEIVLAADVDNPLLGDRGAAAVFGPQKGADPAGVAVLEHGLAILRERLTDTLGPHVRAVADEPGAGAAGGVGFAALAVLGAARRPGIDVILEFVQLPEQVRGADLVLTGEGSLDAQSLGGKTPLGVLRTAQAAGTPTIAVCGRSLLADHEAREAGFRAVHALTDLEPDPDICIRDAAALLHRTGALIAATHRRTPA